MKNFFGKFYKKAPRDMLEVEQEQLMRQERKEILGVSDRKERLWRLEVFSVGLHNEYDEGSVSKRVYKSLSENDKKRVEQSASFYATIGAFAGMALMPVLPIAALIVTPIAATAIYMYKKRSILRRAGGDYFRERYGSLQHADFMHRIEKKVDRRIRAMKAGNAVSHYFTSLAHPDGQNSLDGTQGRKADQTRGIVSAPRLQRGKYDL